ncbi:MAG: hypothetical protein JXB49_29685 [Bacteroidales bacterium]|nr:hypothetical protein [Bacteroidales bacterium]
MSKPIYDSSPEDQLNSIICALDEHPVLCTNPVEESIYLGFKYYTSEEGFQQQIELYYDNFIKYLNTFIKQCSTTGTTDETIIPVLARIFTLYRRTKYRFTHSSLRREWKNHSQYFVIPNPKKDYVIEKQEKYTRWAYKFFYSCSSIQLYFINQMLKDVTILIRANSSGKEAIIKSESIDDEEAIKVPATTKYYFKIEPSVSKQCHNILSNIHKNLKEHGYIDCTLPEFKQVFLSKNPRPIIWLKKYSHLSYFIKELTNVFIKYSVRPSNNQIALKCFFENKYGQTFKVKNIYHDGHYKQYHDKIDTIIDDSINSYVGGKLNHKK